MALLIGLIGDRDDAVTAHQAIPRVLTLSAREVGCAVEPIWLHTKVLAASLEPARACDALWCVPASPYADAGGALAAIRHARERGIPFLGTCGGFQHALLEYVRDQLGFTDAAHAETHPDAAMTLIGRLACELVETTGRIVLSPGSRAAALYGQCEVEETFHCRFGLDARWRHLFERGAMRITGADPTGEARVVELEDHPFFLATMYQPERAGLAGRAHPIVTGFVRATAARTSGVV